MCINYAGIKLWYRQLGNREGKKIGRRSQNKSFDVVDSVQKCKKHVESVENYSILKYANLRQS